MKASVLLSRRRFLATAGTGLTAAFLPPPAKAAVAEFADDLAARLSGHSVGFQFTVSDKYGDVTGRAWGVARLIQDPPFRIMSINDKYNVASVSKTITAAALLRAMYDATHIVLDSAFAPYMPAHWTIHSSLTNVTFKQLLQHRSGFKFSSNVTYAEMKANMATGVDPADIGHYDYNNTNYGVMRLLIPRLAGYGIQQITPGTTGLILGVLEGAQDAQFSAAYIDYTQKRVWDKTGVAPNMACKPTDTYPGLCYQLPPGSGNGTHFGDMTLSCGSRGWNVSSFQLNAFLRALHASATILPEWLANKMIEESLGYDGTGTTDAGTSWYRKGGSYPGSMNPGELHSYVIGFVTGVHLALIVNSPFVSPDGMFGSITKAFDAAYPPTRTINWFG